MSGIRWAIRIAGYAALALLLAATGIAAYLSGMLWLGTCTHSADCADLDAARVVTTGAATGLVAISVLAIVAARSRRRR